jgi:diguanylate cyclase (GGDEF)-like protein/PAS domain S-box-containing protein
MRFMAAIQQASHRLRAAEDLPDDAVAGASPSASSSIQPQPAERLGFMGYDDFPAMVHAVDPEGHLIGVSDHWLAVMGYQREEVLGRYFVEFLTEESRHHALDTVIPTVMQTGLCRDVACQFVKKDGEIIWVLASVTVVRDEAGGIRHILAVLTDVTALATARGLLGQSEQRLQQFLSTASDWLWEMDANLRFCFVSEGHDRTGVASADLLGKTRWDVTGIDPDSHPRWQQHAADLEALRPFRDFEYHFSGTDGRTQHRSVSGTPIFDSRGIFKGYRGTARDITERKKAHMLIEHMALHDALTGLPNRGYFNNELKRACANAQRDGTKIAVMFLDLDNFKDVNDEFGHSVGDKLLLEVAQRLTFCLRQGDLVARFGGDEFAIIAKEDAEGEDIAQLAERIIGTVEDPIDIQGIGICTGLSIGVTIYPDDGDDIERVLANADMALYAAKAEGRRTWRLFNNRMHRIALARRRLDQELTNALERAEFELHYQPLIDISSRQIRGFEALIRWNHPEHGQLLPDLFIPVAERNRLIVPLTEWVLNEALEQRRRWSKLGLGGAKMAVNISTFALNVDDFVDIVASCLQGTGGDPRDLMIEITEGALSDEAKAVPLLNALRRLGVTIAVDDFGTGYSSMSRLKTLPVDLLKIDRSFITNIPEDQGDAAFAEAIAKLGRSLGLQVIAEGVETMRQLRYLARIGCDQAQGFFIGEAMAAARIPAWIESWREKPAAAEWRSIRRQGRLKRSSLGWQRLRPRLFQQLWR